MLVVTIAGVNRTSVLEEDSIRITQLADSFTFTAELALYDASSNIAITAGSHLVADEVTVVDGATTYFGGFVANQDIETAEDGSRHLSLQCQGYGIRLNEVIVATEDYVATADDAIIDDLFDTYLAVFDSVTHVAQIDASISIEFTEMTLVECMNALCQQTQGRWYVDNEKKAHYFADEGVDAGFDLSDEPNDVTSFSYHDRVMKKVDAAAIVNRVRVIGADDNTVTRNDAASQASYGIRAAIVTAHTLTTTTALNERGDGVLDKNKDPRITYVVRTFHDGAVAGNEIDFKCDELGYDSIGGADSALVIREMNIYWAQGRPVYEMTLGSHADISAITRASYTADSIRKVIVSPSIPLASLGWSHDLVFSATDYRTVAWAAGDIGLSGGAGSYGIDAGDTGNMAAVTYIYLDVAVSTTALQTTTSAANAVGARKILVAVAQNVADADTNKAIFQVFGGEGTGVLITADNIAANTISANEIAANAITASEINANAVTADKIIAGAVTAGKIAAQAVTAVKLNIGDMFFNEADGLLLLNLPARITQEGTGAATANYLYGKRGERCRIGIDAAAAGSRGTLHFEPGRWQNTGALVIEEATTNLVVNPSFETDAVSWTWGANAQGAGFGRITTEGFKGVCCGKAVCSGNGSRFMRITATRADTDSDVTFTLWARSLTGISRLRLILFGANWAANSGYSGVFSVGPQWTRLEFTVLDAVLDTFLGGGASFLCVVANDTDNGLSKTWLIDAAQVEENAHATTYCDGDQGDGYSWSGTAHASTSSRVLSYVLLDDLADLITGNDTLSFRIVVQMPYDADGTWPRGSGDNYIWDTRGADHSNRIVLMYDETTDKFEVYINGANRLDSAVQIFDAGDWLDIIVTVDFANDDYNLYVQGVLEDNYALSLSAPTLTAWALGATYLKGYQAGIGLSEYAVFDRVLTAEEVANLHNLQRPLVDMGATEGPGIWILDGQFRIQSSQTGKRISITGEGVDGYDGVSTDPQVRLDGDGLAIVDGTGDVNKIKWLSASLSGTQIGNIYADWAGGGGDAVITWINSLKIAGSDYAAVILRVYDSVGGDDVRLVLTSDNTMTIDEIDTVDFNNNALATYLKFDEAVGIIVYGTRDVRVGGGVVAGSSTVNPATGTIVITDGVGAPGTIAGFASIYVDISDGDLKVRFGNGTIKTIVTD